MRTRVALIVAAAMLAGALSLLARVGGGQSYSDDSSSSSGSSSSGGSSDSSSGGSSSSGSSSSHNYGSSSSGSAGGAVLTCGGIALILLFFLAVIVLQLLVSTEEVSANRNVLDAPARQETPLDDLERFDPNFSRIVFEDFCYALFAHLHRARGSGELFRYAPYVSAFALKALNPSGRQLVKEVRDIIVGSMRVRGLESRRPGFVAVTVDYEANLTEVFDTAWGSSEASWYFRERWTFERKRGVLSPPPARAKAEHCPRCGAALKTRSDGACEYCGVVIGSGEFQWYVTSIVELARQVRGPILTGSVEEQGTSNPTVHQQGLVRWMEAFAAAHPHFDWKEFTRRVHEIALELQDAWTARDWERVRPLETEPLFQTHRYWIDAYVRQKLRNVVADFAVRHIEVVKVTSDAFYDAITVRIRASGKDHTLDEAGNIVAGSSSSERHWSEYWTLIRGRGEDAKPDVSISCPNCGAAVVVGSSGICSHCGGKLTTGAFDWVLSRIEQDESYTG